MSRLSTLARGIAGRGHKHDHREGLVAQTIEEHTARLPSDLFLGAAALSIGFSLALRLLGRPQDAQFVGQWAPTFLLLGLYNKIVKLHGHDHEQRSD